MVKVLTLVNKKTKGENMIDEETGVNNVGRPRQWTGGTRPIMVNIPLEWDNQKKETKQTWAYIIRKGLDSLLKIDEGKDIQNLEENIARLQRVIVRYNEEREQYKLQYEERLKALEKKLREASNPQN